MQEKQQDIQNLLKEAGQEHLLDQSSKFSPQQREQFYAQIKSLNLSYPGGIKQYVNRSKQLLKDSANSVNPFSNFKPSVPKGESIKYGHQDMKNLDQIDQIGLKQLDKVGFVLVAGGLGERLGYSSIKVGLPLTSIEPQYTYLNYYIDYISAFSKRTLAPIPLCIMTSGDTHDKTIKLLEDTKYYGYPKQLISLVKQEKVPALIDNQAHFVFKSSEPYHLIETKPHGHGDIHLLLSQSGIIQHWKQKFNKKWFLIFQDTNALAFRVLPTLLGVSIRNNFAFNSICVARKPGQAVGGICTLTDQNDLNNEITINIQYNVLDSLLRDKWNKDGDIADENGFSYFPGNINCLMLKIDPFLEALKKNGGLIPQFVNPKYADENKTKFKSPTRLECMMQDFPRLLRKEDNVGFTLFPRYMCFSALKNNIADAAVKASKGLPSQSAASAESDIYDTSRRILRYCGVKIEDDKEELVFNGIPVQLTPPIILRPDFGITFKQIRSKIEGACSIESKGGLIVSGTDTKLKNMKIIKGIVIKHQGCLEGELSGKNFKFKQLKEDENEQIYKMRGFRCEIE